MASQGVSLTSSTAAQYAAVQEYAEKEIIARLDIGVADFYNYAQKSQLPNGNGDTVRWTRMGNFGIAGVLTQGAAPTAVAISAYTLTANITQRGLVTTYSDIWGAAAVAGAVKDVIPNATTSMKRSVDVLLRNVLHYGTFTGNGYKNLSKMNMSKCGAYGLPVVMCGGGGNAPLSEATISALMSANYMAVKDIRKAVMQLRSVGAPTFADNTYKLFVHPVVAGKLRTDTEFQAWNQYTNASKMEKGVVGMIEGCEVIETPNMYFTGSGTSSIGTVSAYFSILLAKGALGVTELQKAGKMTIVEGADKTDPLNQWTSIGYKFAIAGCLLNASCGRTLVSTGDGVTKPPLAW